LGNHLILQQRLLSQQIFNSHSAKLLINLEQGFNLILPGYPGGSNEPGT